MINNYRKLFQVLHGDQQRIKFSGANNLTEITYDTINNRYYGRLSNPNVLQPKAVVFGWHPYWITDAYKYYPYTLLSTIAFFAYDINENDGTCYDQDVIRTWRSTSLIDSAKKYNVKILLTVTSYGRERNARFLKNDNAWSTLGDSLKSLLQARKADGIDIDFFEIPKERTSDFTRFINSLRTKLGNSFAITLHLTTGDLKNGSFNLEELKPMISTFIVQGNDYEEEVLVKGPLAPLYTKEKQGACIANTIDFCLHHGLNSEDIVLSLPLYGRVWYGAEPREMPYDDIVSLYNNNNASKPDIWSESALINRGDTIINYESAESLYRKFSWARTHQLQGVGLWGLGYDGGRPEVWNAVAANYAMQPIREIFPIATDNGNTYTFIYALQKYRKAIGAGLLITISFFILGVLLSLLDWRVREIFFRNFSNRALLSLLIIFIGIVAVYFMTDAAPNSNNSLVVLLTGLAIGGLVVYLSSKLYMNYRRKMP
jgi:spore germination protein